MWIGHLDMEMNVSDRIQPRSTPAEKKRVVIRKKPWRPLLLIVILLILAFPAFKFGTGAGQRIFPAVANFFYNISGPPLPPTPTPLPPFPASLPQFGSLLYTVQSGDSCDEMLTVQMHIGSWVWSQAMLARKQITGFANYPYVDPNVSLNGMLLRACDLQVDNTHDDNSLACSQLPPNTIIDDGGAWLFGVTGPGSLNHWRYPLRLPAGTRVLLWLSAQSNGGLGFHQANPVYRNDVGRQI